MRGLERVKSGPGRGNKNKTPHAEASFSKSKPEPSSEYQQARIDAGISKRTAERWQELAAIPQEKFEEALRDPVLRPTTAGIIVRATEPKKIPPADPRALWVWGRLRDWEREGILKEEPRQIAQLMDDLMRPDVLRLIQPVANWLMQPLEAMK